MWRIVLVKFGWLPIVLIGFGVGCQEISYHFTKWDMLDPSAVNNPLLAVGGDGMFFVCKKEVLSKTRADLAQTSPDDLIDYYAPIFLQQRINTQQLDFPYPPENDSIGQAGLRRETDGKLKAVVGGDPVVYAIQQKKNIGGTDHIQITYTAWYPAHPRMKAIDLESADVDSVVLRITLDSQNAPLFYETIAASGAFHKVFVVKWLEEASAAANGPPEKGKKYSIEKTVPKSIDWEVAGVVDDPPDRPRRPVVFVTAGEHKVIGIGTEAKLHLPKDAVIYRYNTAPYSDLYNIKFDSTMKPAAFFDLEGKVWGSGRGERFVFGLVGVNDAGTPRANDKIKLHFDQSAWDDSTIYTKYLRLPPKTLQAGGQ